MSQILPSVPRGNLPFILLISGTDKQRTKILSSMTFYYFSVPWSMRKLRHFPLQFYEYACPIVHTVVFCCVALMLLPTWKICISTLFSFFLIWLLMLKINLFIIWNLSWPFHERATNKGRKTSPNFVLWLLLFCDCEQLLPPQMHC